MFEARLVKSECQPVTPKPGSVPVDRPIRITTDQSVVFAAYIVVEDEIRGIVAQQPASLAVQATAGG